LTDRKEPKRLLLTMENWVQSQSSTYGIYGGENGNDDLTSENLSWSNKGEEERGSAARTNKTANEK
jgi:hypothetical protein